jgi:hypothetical protein
LDGRPAAQIHLVQQNKYMYTAHHSAGYLWAAYIIDLGI